MASAVSMKSLMLLGLAAVAAGLEAIEAEFIVQRTTKSSVFGEIGTAGMMALSGIVMVIVAFPLLWGNERRQAKMWQLLGRAQAIVKRNVSSDKIDPSNEASLVHVQGITRTADVLKDEQFGISVENSAHLRRDVEMYQWKEHSKTEERDTMMGGKEKVTTYTYNMTWSDPINSSDFQEAGHDNPPFPFGDDRRTATLVSFGAFELGPRLTGMLSNFKPLSAAELPKEVPCKGVGGKAFSLQAGGGYSTEAPGVQPQIGDMRVKFSKVPCGDATVMGIQHNNSFVPFKYTMKVSNGRVVHASGGKEPLLAKSNTAAVLDDAIQEESLEAPTGCCSLCSCVAGLVELGEEIYVVTECKVSAQEVLKSVADGQQCLNTTLQIVGFILFWLGFYLIFGFLPAIFRIIPFLGTWIQLFGNILALIASFLFALVCWCVTVALAWLSMRPGKALLLLSVATALLLVPTMLAQAHGTGVAPPA